MSTNIKGLYKNLKSQKEVKFQEVKKAIKLIYKLDDNDWYHDRGCAKELLCDIFKNLLTKEEKAKYFINLQKEREEEKQKEIDRETQMKIEEAKLKQPVYTKEQLEYYKNEYLKEKDRQIKNGTFDYSKVIKSNQNLISDWTEVI